MAERLTSLTSRIDALKRQLFDALQNPADYASMLGGRVVESGQAAKALQSQAFADPRQPFKVTDENALRQLTDMMMAGPLGFAPAGTMNVEGLANRGREFIRSSADDLAAQLNKLGFKADVTHSGSAAGPSSYVKVFDPETGRYFGNPVRFSGHSKGAFNLGEVRDVSDPALDIPRILEDALAMRAQGPAAAMQKQKLVDELIASGVKPRKAYKQANEMTAKGLLEPTDTKSSFKVVQPGDQVSGLTVRKEVPNMGSISATLDDYEVLSGIREVPRVAFDKEYLDSLSFEKLDKRTKDLANQINASKEINPLIVGVDSKGAYIIEGGHRFDALMAQNTKSIPAMVVIDKSDPPSENVLRELFGD